MTKSEHFEILRDADYQCTMLQTKIPLVLPTKLLQIDNAPASPCSDMHNTTVLPDLLRALRRRALGPKALLQKAKALFSQENREIIRIIRNITRYG